jgi:DNA-binding MarR family transcriptional regulator
MHLKTVSETITQIVSEETGELIDVIAKKTKIVVDSKDEFIQLYSAVNAKLLKLTHTEETVFFYCAFNCDSTNVIVFNKYRKDILAEQTGLSSATLSNVIPKLIKSNLLVRLSDATYRVNPEYAWKSTSNSRKTVMKHFLEYECSVS